MRDVYVIGVHTTKFDRYLDRSIKDLAAEGMTCILVTHEMGFAREIADHIYFTDRGVIVEHGPPKTFFKSAKDPRTREFLSQIL